MATPPRRSAAPGKNSKGLTPKREKFAQGVASGMTQADAYRAAFDASKSKPETVQSHASRVMANDKVATRVDALRKKATERHLLTVEDILRELEEARVMAATGERPQVSAMVAASMGKAKVLGLASDKVIHSGDANNPIVVHYVRASNV
jgi:phage terminase small subunit